MNTNFFQALKKQNSSLISSFLLAGFDPNSVDESGNTALHYTVKKNNSHITSLLLEESADPNKEDAQGRPPLSYAVEAKNSYITSLLLEASADPDFVNQDQDTLLHIAVAQKNSYITSILLEAGANPNLRDAKGETPLFSALRKQESYLVSLLLEAGAHAIGKPNNNKEYPLDIAFQKNNNYLITLLLEAGAYHDTEKITSVSRESVNTGFFDKILVLVSQFMAYFQKKNQDKISTKQEIPSPISFYVNSVDLSELKDMSEKKTNFSHPQLDSEFSPVYSNLQKQLKDYLNLSKKHEAQLSTESIENLVFLKNNFKTVASLNQKVDALAQDIEIGQLQTQTKELGKLYSEFSHYIFEAQQKLNNNLLASLSQELEVEKTHIGNKNKKIMTTHS